MTMNYCGRCGSANGATARFCRQCGADLSSQAAASSSSTPFDIEFSTRSVIKNSEKEAKPAISETEPAPKPAEDTTGDRISAALSESLDQDPKAISASLRRIRASGPLILAAIKQNDRESMERINEIIEQSIQGMSEDKAPGLSDDKAPVRPPIKSENVPAAPTQQLKPREVTKPMTSPVREAAVPQPNRPLNSGSVAKPNPQAPQAPQGPQAMVRATLQKSARAVVKTPAQADARISKQKAAGAMAQSIARRVTNWMSVSNLNRPASHTPIGAHSGPSTVLMQASGFKPKSNIGPKVILGIMGLAVLLAFPIYFIFRDRLLTQAQPVDGDLNLISPADQSAQLVKAGIAERAQGKYRIAIDHFHHALELTPNNMDARFTLGQLYVEAGQIDDAIKICREIVRIQPGHLDARLQLAAIYLAKGNWTAAYTQYRYIIEYDQSSPQAADALAAIESQQAVALMEERAAENARRGRRRSRANIPSLPVAAIRAPVPFLSSGLTAIRRVDPPEAMSGAGVEEKPDPRGLAESHKRLGVRYLNIREYRAAINEFLQALNMTPDDKDLYYFIGSSYHGLGYQAEAYDYYRRVDAGPYVGPAESGAKQTRKAAQDASKRRNDPKLPPLKNELEEINQNKPTKHKSVMNKIWDSIR